MATRKLLRFSIAVLFVLGLQSSAFSAWLVENEPGAPVLAVSEFSGGQSEPILLVYENGTVLWSPEYYSRGEEGNVPRYDNFLERYARQVDAKAEAERLKRIGAIIEKVEKEGQLAKEEKLDRLQEEYHNDPVLSSLSLREVMAKSSLSPALVAAMADELARKGFYELDFPRAIRSRSWMVVSLHWQGEYREIYGPSGNYHVPGLDCLDISLWRDNDDFPAAWMSLLPKILAIQESTNGAASAIDGGLVAEKKGIPPWLTSPAASLLPASEISSGQLTSSAVTPTSTAAGELLARAEALWGSGDKREAIRVLGVSGEAIDQREKPVVDARLGYYALAMKEDDIATAAFTRAKLLASVENWRIKSDSIVRLGYLALRNGDKDKALIEFSKVAVGCVPATAEAVQESRFRTASLLRQHAMFEHAGRMYELLAEEATPEKDKERARVELAGLVFERAKGNYGKVDNDERGKLLQQARELAQRVSGSREAADADKAIADLMHLETFYYEKEHAKVIEEGAAYQAKWSGTGPRQQLVTAMTYVLFSAYEAGRYEEAIRTAREIRSNFAFTDAYPALNSFAYSMLYESFALDATGDAEGAKRLREECRKTHPEWYSQFAEREAKQQGRQL